MAIGIALLCVSSLILLFFAPRSRYGLPLLLLCGGITLQMIAILFLSYSTVTYSSFLYFPLRQMDLALYNLLKAVKLSMNTAQRIRAVSCMMFLTGINAFLYVLSGHVYQSGGSRKRLLRGIVCAVPAILPVLCLFYFLPENAFHIYLKLCSLSGNSRSLYTAWITRADRLIHILICAGSVLPIIVLCTAYLLKRMTCFRDTFTILLLSLLVADTLFLAPVFTGNFRMDASSAIRHGFWLFPATERVSAAGTLLYPFLSLLTLIFTLISVRCLLGRELVFSSKEHALKRSIDELNRDMKEVFHSEKNLLFSIRILTEEIKNAWGTPEGLEKLERLREVCDHRMDVIAAALNRVRELHLHPNPTDLRSVADSVVDDLVIPEGITVQKEYCPFPVRCVIDPYHTAGALRNLISNSFDALQLSGIKNGTVRVRIAASRSRVSIQVCDNGPGIEKSALRRVMMPFVSTKPKTESWGIGLPYVFRVVNAQLGQMRISSDQGEHSGTTVEILLPRDRRKHE